MKNTLVYDESLPQQSSLHRSSFGQRKFEKQAPSYRFRDNQHRKVSYLIIFSRLSLSNIPNCKNLHRVIFTLTPSFRYRHIGTSIHLLILYHTFQCVLTDNNLLKYNAGAHFRIKKCLLSARKLKTNSIFASFRLKSLP